jgi:hypothetical protein
VPHVRLSVRGPNKTGDPDFLYAAPNRFACAAFCKESRMKFANATKLHRKSGGSPPWLLQNRTEKAIETYHFRPRYALANLGHPSSSYWVLLGNWLALHGNLRAIQR